VPRWDNAPQAHSSVSNINVDIYKYPMKNISRTAKVGKNFAVLDIFLFGIFININCDIWKNISRTAKFLPTFG
jgi:hypothetical protein